MEKDMWKGGGMKNWFHIKIKFYSMSNVMSRNIDRLKTLRRRV